MEKELFEMMKIDYEDMKKVVNEDNSELEELKKNPIVQRYLKLNELKESRLMLYYLSYGNDYLISELIDKYGHGDIKETNNIWCMMYEKEAREVKFRNVTFLEDVEDDKIVVVYTDIENKNRSIAISKEKQDEFEKTHNVVYGNPLILDYSDRYYKVRSEFFRGCITDDQDVAVKRMIQNNGIRR